jgi:hypothetical protein
MHFRLAFFGLVCERFWMLKRSGFGIFLKAFFWSLGFEALLFSLLLGGYIGLPFLPYLFLVFHFPAYSLIECWPGAREDGWIAPIFIQWIIWFLLFTAFFALCNRLRGEHASAHAQDSK